MACVTIFSCDFCNGSDVVKEVLERTELTLITENNIIAKAHELSGMDEEKLERAFSPKTSVFDRFTHEKENALAHLRLAVAEILSNDNNLLIAGYSGLLVPREITHVLHVCLVGDIQHRINVAIEKQGLSEKNAKKMITELDQERAYWVKTLHDTEDPWDRSLYDLIIPIGTSNIKDAAALIDDYLNKSIIKPTDASKRAVDNFLLSSQVAVALRREGHDVDVSASNSKITLTINKHVLLLHRLEDELKTIVSKLPGVKSVET